MDRPIDCHVERRATRMTEMMSRLGVDKKSFAASAEGHLFQAARDRCLACSEVGECLAWLDGRRQDRSAPAFCPNEPRFLAFAQTENSDDYQI